MSFVIDGSYVPSLGSGVIAMPVAEETLLFDEQRGMLHQLDPIGAAVCSCMDGETSIDQAVDELAAAFGAPRDQVASDVLALVEEFGRLGLLDGLEPEPAPAAIKGDDVQFPDSGGACGP
ncbi:PqqD family protein [Egicoccus halophilus]|uniref:Coenzyme PQQ synthesis protein D (PqqD) n=1 Tax=Egicoccus halophilus TaxID=1670830 RepID=A0A8J3ETC8_9ACTN|nr:PqqD family protein [Egicoccus halophilus]GGI05354.1 hypothetical protein GCM10011354_13680 [Egicoccus halophilus]